MALRLLLAAGLSASEEAGLEMLAYEFFEEAFTLYEESVADQRQRITALQSIIGTLQRCYVFGAENRCGQTSQEESDGVERWSSGTEGAAALLCVWSCEGVGSYGAQDCCYCLGLCNRR